MAICTSSIEEFRFPLPYKGEFRDLSAEKHNCMDSAKMFKFPFLLYQLIQSGIMHCSNTCHACIHIG